MFTNPTLRPDTPISSASSDYTDALFGSDLQSTDRWDTTLPPFHSPSPLRLGGLQSELAMQPSLSSQALQSSISTSGYDVRLLLQRIRELEAQHALLTQRVYELQGELTGSKAAYNALLERLPSDGSPITSGENTTHVRAAPPSTPAEAALQAVRNPPRIVTLQRKDYRRIRFWFVSEFSGWIKGEQDVTQLGPEEEEVKPSKLAYRFLEDEAGGSIEHRKGVMLEMLYSIWRSLLHVPGLLPAKWGKASFEVQMYVWATMEEAFVELRFCDGHWKAQRLATLNYPWWYGKHVRSRTSIDNESGCQPGGEGGRSHKTEGKRSAVDAALESSQVTKKPKNKVKSIFPSSSGKKTPARSPLSTVTTAVTSTAATEAAASSQLTTATISTDADLPHPPSIPNIPHGDSGSLSTAATPDATGIRSTEEQEQTQQYTTGAIKDRAQEASSDASGQLERTCSELESSHQDELQADRAADTITTRLPTPSAKEILNSPSTSSSAPTSCDPTNPSPFDPAPTSFAYPSVTIPATGNKSDPISAAKSTSIAPPSATSAALDASQDTAPLTSDTGMTATTSTTLAEASSNSKTISRPAASTSKTVTPYMLCRQDFERAHPGVNKKSMTVLFKAHWKQMGKDEKEEWQKRARSANESHAQAAQAISTA